MGSEYRRSYEEQEQELYQSSSETHSYGTRQPHMTLYNSVIEEKIVIEQVDTSRSRRLQELRVN